MHVITWFKNKTPTFFTFQNFYNKYWGVSDFIYCIGYTSENNKQYILNTYFEECNFAARSLGNSNLSPGLMENMEMYMGRNEKYNFAILLYKTDIRTPIGNWGKIQNVFAAVVLPNISPKIKLLVVDDDEFLYSRHIDEIKKGDRFRFHFVDYVCEDTFNKSNLNWSIQGWSHTHCLYAEKGEAWKTYYCGGCKMYRWTKGPDGGWDWCHGGKNVNDSVVCRQFKFREPDAMDLNKRTDEELNKILEDGGSFHFIGLTSTQLREIKQENRYSNGNWQDRTFQNTNRLIKKNLRVVNNNLLSSVISDKDIELSS